MTDWINASGDDDGQKSVITKHLSIKATPAIGNPIVPLSTSCVILIAIDGFQYFIVSNVGTFHQIKEQIEDAFRSYMDMIHVDIVFVNPENEVVLDTIVFPRSAFRRLQLTTNRDGFGPMMTRVPYDDDIDDLDDEEV